MQNTKEPRAFKNEWQNILQTLKDNHDKARCPESFEVNGSIRGKWDDQTANGLTRAVIDFLNYLGGNFTRINTMGTPRKNKYGQLIFTKSTTKLGTADILGCFQGRYVAIEIKIGADRQSVEQRREQADVTAAGGIYIIARSMQGFINDFRTKLKQ